MRIDLKYHSDAGSENLRRAECEIDFLLPGDCLLHGEWVERGGILLLLLRKGGTWCKCAIKFAAAKWKVQVRLSAARHLRVSWALEMRAAWI